MERSVHTCHCRPTGRPNNKGCDRLNEINKTSSPSQTMRTNGVVAGMQEENFAPSGTPATPSKFWFFEKLSHNLPVGKLSSKNAKFGEKSWHLLTK